MGAIATQMYGGMNDETGLQDRIGTIHHLVAFAVNLHQAGGSDLAEFQPKGIDQKMLCIGNAGRVVSEHPVIPTVMRQQTVASGQVFPLLPLRVADHISDPDFYCSLGHVTFPSLMRSNFAQWHHGAQGTGIPFPMNFDDG